MHSSHLFPRIELLLDDYELVIRKITGGRDSSLRRFYFKYQLGPVADHTGQSLKTIHERMKQRYNPITIEGSSGTIMIGGPVFSKASDLEFYEKVEFTNQVADFFEVFFEGNITLPRWGKE